MSNWIKPLRTALQAGISVLPLLPVLLPALGISVTVGVGAAIISVSGLLSRFMATELGEAIMEKFGLKSPEVSNG